MSILDTVIQMPCHPNNRGGGRSLKSIKYLVYHYTANDGDSARNNAIYYRDNVVKASAHYYVDDNTIYQSVADDLTAWAVGGKKWADTDTTGGGSLYGIVKNANSLSIELCDTNRNGELMATEATLARAVELGKALMAKYNIPIERVIRHFDVTGKYCPVYYMDNAKWAAFKERLVEKEVKPMTEEEFKAMLKKVMGEVNAQPPADWAKEAWAKMAERGIMDGTRPCAPITRQEVAVLLDRLGL